MSTGERGAPKMDKKLLSAASCGSTELINELSRDLSVLLGVTPQGNNCLHISASRGHQQFCESLVDLNYSLLENTNSDSETPLLKAVKCGHSLLANSLLKVYTSKNLVAAISHRDKHGGNALHYAIRGGDEKLAKELIKAGPDLAKHENKFGESPMFIAAMKNFTDLTLTLLEDPGSLDCGPLGMNCLHAAVNNGNKAIIEKIMEKREWLATVNNGNKAIAENITQRREGLATNSTDLVSSPVCMAVHNNKIDSLRVLLEHDSSLGYMTTKDGHPLLKVAAYGGHVGVAQELLNHCPDAPYQGKNHDSATCLHTAVQYDFVEFVHFILKMPQLRGLINMRNSDGKTALHIAVDKCNSTMVTALLQFGEAIDKTVLDKKGSSAVWELSRNIDRASTLTWSEVSMRMLRANPLDASSIYNLHTRVKRWAINASRMNARSFTKSYSNSSLMLAIFIATISFAAIFTVPGGYSSAIESGGLPVMHHKTAFKAFMIFDVIAFFSSVVVCSIWLRARWHDYELLAHYRSSTQMFLSVAIVATCVAFSTCLYAELAPDLLSHAVGICSLVALLLFVIWLVGNWHLLKLRYELGTSLDRDLLDMV